MQNQKAKTPHLSTPKDILNIFLTYPVILKSDFSAMHVAFTLENYKNWVLPPRQTILDRK